MRSLLICCCCLVFLALILLLFNNFNKKKQYYDDDDEENQNRCIMTYMWRRMFFMETRLEHPRYSLFLYGEGYYAQKFGSTGTLDGIPILFVPGNAGSGRQVRSIGSLLQNKTERRRTHFHFDTFAVDFNEELTALDFEYINSQSEFLLIAIDWIWSLYGKKPHEIVLIGHSMGGIVIQAAMMNQKFKKEKVSFILAFATPYSEPPFYFDKRFYNFWKNFHEIKNPIKKVISISGGLKDEFIEEIWTNSTAVTIHSFTSSIDKVWLDMDHKCILWCNQLVRQTSRLLFDYALNPEIFIGNFHKFAHRHYESIGIQLRPLDARSTNDSNQNSKEMVFIKHFQGRIILLISAIESNVVPENEFITFNKCGGKIHQITRYLDRNHLFTFANVTNCAMQCGAIIENNNEFWILKEEEVMKPQLRINLINQNILQFSMENIPLIIIPMDFIGDDFLIYRIKISRLDCKNRDFSHRIFFMENDRIRRANEIKGENENQQYSSILVYSNNAFANEYKIMLIDANKCKKILLEFSIDLRLSLIKALRLNRHILPFSIASTFVYVCLQLYKSKSFNCLFAIIIALLFHNIRQPLCLAFILLIDAIFFITTNLICILLIRPPLNKFVKTNDRQNSLYFPPLILKSLIFIFTVFAGNTSAAAIFFALENIMSFNKLFENDLIFASMVALQLCSELIQLPSIWTSLWNIAKYGEWNKGFDPFYEANLYMMLFIIFLNFIVPIKNLSNLYDKIVVHRKIHQFINFFPNLIFLILVVYIVYRNPMCIFIMDDLSLLINLFLIYKIIRQMQYKT